MIGRAGTCCVALVLAAATASVGPAGQAAPFRLLGDAEAAWLMAADNGGCKLAVKPLGKPWQSRWAGQPGTVSAATAVRGSAVLLFARGGHVRYFAYQPKAQPGTNAPKELWPEGTIAVAACPAEAEQFDAMLVLASNEEAAFQSAEPVTTVPAAGTSPSAPSASRPGPRQPATPARKIRSSLALLQYAGQEWALLSVVPPRFVRRPFQAHLAVHRGIVYLLLDHRPAPTLVALEKGRWRQLELPAAVAPSSPLALISMPEGIVLAVFDEAGRAGITRLAAGKWTELQPLHRNGQAATWAADARPAVARLGPRLALAWREGADWLFGTCGLDGKLDQTRVDVFETGWNAAQAADILQKFLTGVLILTIVLMFWPRQAFRTGPFALPATMVPARLDRRGMALVIDTAPFAILAILAVGGVRRAPWGKLPEEELLAWLVYAMLIFLVVYPAYCILMEQIWAATVGKRVMRLRVVGNGGRKPLLREVALRNVSKIPELVALTVVIPLLFPVLTRYRQRLGDKIAWTAVIDTELSLPPELVQEAGDEEQP